MWELYDTNTDWTQAKDLAKENPKKLAELQRLFLIEATKYSVLPLDDRTFERFNPDLAGRPQLIQGNTQILFGGMGRLTENSIVNIKNKSYAITADVDVPKAGAEGVIVAQGGSINGWSLYAKGGKLKYCYNFFGIDADLCRVGASRSPPAIIRSGWSSSTTAAALPRAAPSRSTSTASRSAQGRVERTVPMAYSADETCDVGKESGSPVSPDYGPSGNEFSWRGELGAVRPREGRPRSPDLAGRALQGGDGAAVERWQ